MYEEDGKRGTMLIHTCIATPKEMMSYRIVCANCGLKTETDSDKWTPAQGTFECPRCGANYLVTPHAKAKGEFWD
jgi:transcription elongation factor Elf1